MAIASAMVLYCVIWAILFYLINPLWQTSQSEDGEVVPGTPGSAPVDAMLRKKAIVTTVIASVQTLNARQGDGKRMERFDPMDFKILVIDEAHRLRNVYKASSKLARRITDAVRHAPKLLLTATPLQNSLMELFGLVSVMDEASILPS